MMSSSPSSSSSSSQALTKRQSDQSLMPPPPPPKRIKRPATVLDEDVYTDALSQIIARDFFPGLLETQIKQEYLDALESKNKEWIAVARKKLTDVMTTPARARAGAGAEAGSSSRGTPSGTPAGLMDRTPAYWAGDTPASTVSSITTGTATSSASMEPTAKDTPDVSKLGLLAFQAQYTSEDNESFNRLIDKQNAKHREKYAWIWSENKIPSARQIAHQRKEAKRITAQGGDPSKEQGNKQLIKTDLDARPAKPDAWKARPENSLMFIPSSIEDTHETIQQRGERLSRAEPKHIIYQNTRIQDPATTAALSDKAQRNSDADAPPTSPSISAVKDAIAGRPHLSNTEIGSTTGDETPRVNGYSFVDEDDENDLQQPGPSSSSNPNDLSLLGTGDEQPNPFHIGNVRKREDLHHRMVDRMVRTRRAEKAAQDVRKAVPRFPSSPMLDFGLRSSSSSAANARDSGSSGTTKTFSPAAHKIIQRMGSSTSHGSRKYGSGSGSASSSSGLKNMWTPKPKRK